MAEYRISTRAKTCAATGEPFQEGQVIVTAIDEDPEDGFIRRDYSEQGFLGAGGAFSYWRSRLPVTPDEGRKLDFDLALNFLQKLIAQADPEREGLAYTLVLLLARKRRVKIKVSRPLPDGELLTVVVPGPEEDREVTMHAPRLTPDDVTRIQTELATLFGFEPPEAAEAEAEMEATDDPSESAAASP